MGVQFESLDKLLAPHVGKFWAIVETDYPQCSENPPITPHVEDFAKPGGVVGQRMVISPKPDLPRVFLHDPSGHWLIQIQRDRFLHNWRIVSNTSEYPRYPVVSQRFFDQWSKYQEFVTKNELGTIRITQLEITYLNRIPLASSRLGEVFPDCRWRHEQRILCGPESMEVSCSFKSESEPKRLRVTIRPGIQQDQQEMLFELTVRGSLDDEETLDEWFSAGREWIVKAFADLTSEEWHVKWRRTA